jgi:hypothetical protein
MLQSTDDNYISNFIFNVNKKAFNLCFNESVTLLELLQMTCKRMLAEGVKFIHERDLYRNGKFFLPSAECGVLSSDLAVELLGWKPSSIEDAVGITVDFFMGANTNPKYDREHKDCVNKFSSVVAFYTNNKGRCILNNNQMEIVIQNTQQHTLK